VDKAIPEKKEISEELILENKDILASVLADYLKEMRLENHLKWQIGYIHDD